MFHLHQKCKRSVAFLFPSSRGDSFYLLWALGVCLWLDESGKLRSSSTSRKKSYIIAASSFGPSFTSPPAPLLYRVTIRTSDKDVKSLDLSFEPKSHILGSCSNAAFKVDFSLKRGLQFEVPWIPARQTWPRIYGLYHLETIHQLS